MTLNKMRRENYNPKFVQRQGRNVHIKVEKNAKGTFTAKVDTHGIEVEATTSDEAARMAERAVQEQVSKDGGATIQQNLV